MGGEDEDEVLQGMQRALKGSPPPQSSLTVTGWFVFGMCKPSCQFQLRVQHLSPLWIDLRRAHLALAGSANKILRTSETILKSPV